MSAVQPNEGKVQVLTTLAMVPGQCALKLFSNNFSPTVTTVTGNFTEPSFPGYAPIDFILDGSPTIDAAGQATGVKSICTFTNTGVSDIVVYGWWLTLKGGGWGPWCWFAKEFTSPQTIVANGGTLTFQITLNGGDITPA